ncbi:threonine-tRNA ligase [Anncaliia algerae PRA339]|uniref:Probable threonine--tRNA ligase, cytoplasmic n=1 Tax=Anncaliia algerae PRA339 TaxID=1288291 RepID=A0A059EYF6_9MICR|nr:threonine-tRNA ligase [Anncaliia algerae PRA339]
MKNDFTDDEYKKIFWHSSAHVLGMAIMRYLPEAKLSHGPPIEEGFFYDFYSPHPITPLDMEEIEKICKEIIKKNYKITQDFISFEELEIFYSFNKFKSHFLKESDEKILSVYKIEEFVDLCKGPHVPSTGTIKSFKLLKNSSSYFLGNNSNESLQRIYGISFPSTQEMKEYLEFLRLSESRDHRKIGQELDLFHFDQLSPGSAFFLPDGTIVYNRLMNILRKEYKIRGYQEVITPNIYDLNLWKESGHYENYKEHMFLLKDESFGLKPMNCPGHCLLFKRDEVSYKDLPMRLADFGVLHRNEVKGSLSGLTRVRRFQQDDAHIFCGVEHLRDEIRSCISFLDYMYSLFNFTYELKLSTRPEKFLGDIEIWNNAEDILKEILQDYKYQLNEGDGAFYGPKIDVVLKDALNRKHQCGTIQLDFQLPQRFKLRYKDKEGYSTPIIIHRAIFGSLERFIAIVLENHGKNLPFWFTPKQIAIIKVNYSSTLNINYEEEFSKLNIKDLPDLNTELDKYITNIKRILIDYEVLVIDDENLSLNKKVRNAITKGYKVVLIIGKGELKNNTVNLKLSKENKEISINQLVEYCKKMTDDKKDYEFGELK